MSIPTVTADVRDKEGVIMYYIPNSLTFLVCVLILVLGCAPKQKARPRCNEEVNPLFTGSLQPFAQRIDCVVLGSKYVVCSIFTVDLFTSDDLIPSCVTNVMHGILSTSFDTNTAVLLDFETGGWSPDQSSPSLSVKGFDSHIRGCRTDQSGIKWETDLLTFLNDLTLIVPPLSCSFEYMVPESLLLRNVLGEEWSGALVFQAVGREPVAGCPATRVQVNAVGANTNRISTFILSGTLYLHSETHEIVRAGAEVTHRYLIEITAPDAHYSTLVTSKRTTWMKRDDQ